MKCAIIGCGNIAGGFDSKESDLVRTHAKAFVENPDCDLLAVADVDLEKAKDFARRWQVKDVFNDLDEMLTMCKPDLLSICTPTHTHFELLEIAVKKNVKIVWLEKPAAGSIEDVETMINFCNNSDTKIWVNYFRRYDPGFQKVKEKIESLGDILSVNAFYSKGIRHNGSHMIDIINFLLGPITDILGGSLDKDSQFPSFTGLAQSLKAKINFKSFDYKKFEIFELDIIGEQGRIRILDGGQEIHFFSVKESKYYSGYKNMVLDDIHTGTYGYSMRNGLKWGLQSLPMPNLKNELEIQKTLENISRVVQVRI